MAQKLNHNRIVVGKIMSPLVFLLCLLTASPWPDNMLLHEINDFIGIMLIFICVAGRVYCTLFIGGRKNSNLVIDGPYSMVRNPLYFFSFIGVLGIGFYSNHFLTLTVLVAIFALVYRKVIQREETFLEQEFGEEYTRYKNRVPAFIPNPSLYRVPNHINTQLRFVHKALADAVWWVMPIIFFETIEYLHDAGIVMPLLVLP